MDLVEYGDISNGCEDENYGFASGFLEDCSNHTENQGEEPVFGLVELVCVTVVYIALMLLGLLGNMLTILVVWLRPHMRTSTYLYLSSMSVSDLLILLLLPLDLYKLWKPRPWPFGDLACKLTMFVSECCTYCTILHITFLSLERYLAVCWPIMAKTFVTRRRTRTLIGCLWLGAAVSAAPVLVMVGVEDVGGEEAQLGGSEEDAAWTSTAGKQGGLIIVGNASEQFASVPGELEREKGWGEGVTEMKWLRKEGEKNIEPTELQTQKQKEGEETNSDIKKKADVRGGQERGGKIKEKEDMEGEEDDSIEATQGVMDNRECRCSDYAISSGLLSAMMILSNLYFLISLCILGLVYGLIGRTLWLRPQSNCREPTHRHTIKMLGVIVLAFVLCWLPFHIGRTLITLSLGTGTDGQEVPMELYADTGTLSNTSIVMGTNKSYFTAQSDPDKHVRTVSSIVVNTDADAQRELPKCNICAKTKVKNNTYMGNMSMHADNGTHGSITHINTHADTLLYYLSQYFKLVSSVLLYLSAAVNPLLYNLMSVRYRHAVHSLMHTQSHSHAQRLHTLTSTTHTTTTTTTTTL